MKKINLKSILIIILSPVILFLADILACVLSTSVIFSLRLILYKLFPLATSIYIMSGRLYHLAAFYMPFVRISYAIMTIIFIVEAVKYFNRKYKHHKTHGEKLSDVKTQIIFKESDNNI